MIKESVTCVAMGCWSTASHYLSRPFNMLQQSKFCGIFYTQCTWRIIYEM